MKSCNKMESPWIQRVRALLANPDLQSVLTRNSGPIMGLAKEDEYVAGQLLRRHLASQYVPSGQHVQLARRILATGLAFALKAYPDVKTYISRSQLAAVEVDPEPLTWLITGLAGLGKSALISRLEELFADAPIFQASEQCAPEPMLGAIFLRMTGRVSHAQAIAIIAQRLGMEVDTGDKISARTITDIRSELYRQGCLFILVDESQALASGKGAGAIYVNFIAMLRRFGLPVIVVGNFSMAHGMLQQHSQNRQRLLADPFVMLQDLPGDAQYLAHLQAYKDACGDMLRIDPKKDALTINFLTGGNSRALLNLVSIAYERERANSPNPHVDLDALQRAHGSQAFAVFREEIDLLRTHRLTGRHIRADLTCPFELAGDAAKREKELVDELRRRTLAQAIVDSAGPPLPVPAAPSGAPAEPATAQDDPRAGGIDDEPPQKWVVKPAAASRTPAAQKRPRRPPPTLGDALRTWG